MNKRIAKTSPDPIDKYVGSRVRARRLGLRMSQTKLGEAVGVTFQQIQKYENGTNRVGASNLYKIGRTLGVEVGYFFHEMPEAAFTAKAQRGLADQEPMAFEHDPLTSRESIELSHNYFRIVDEKVRKKLFQLVKSLGEALAD